MEIVGWVFQRFQRIYSHFFWANLAVLNFTIKHDFPLLSTDEFHLIEELVALMLRLHEDNSKTLWSQKPVAKSFPSLLHFFPCHSFLGRKISCSSHTLWFWKAFLPNCTTNLCKILEGFTSSNVKNSIIRYEIDTTTTCFNTTPKSLLPTENCIAHPLIMMVYVICYTVSYVF